jgi:hypothetical protein
LATPADAHGRDAVVDDDMVVRQELPQQAAACNPQRTIS